MNDDDSIMLYLNVVVSERFISIYPKYLNVNRFRGETQKSEMTPPLNE